MPEVSSLMPFKDNSDICKASTPLSVLLKTEKVEEVSLKPKEEAKAAEHN